MVSLIAELKQRLDEQLDPNSSVSFEITPYQLTIRYRGRTVGSWRATREGARWHGIQEHDADLPLTRDVYDALEVTKRALFVFIRDAKNLDRSSNDG